MVGPLQELHVVDQENVDLAQLLLEGERVARAQGLHEARHEALGGEIEHLRFGLALLHVPRDGVQQMGFAEPDIAVHEQGVEQRLRRRERASHLLRGGISEPVRGPDHEALKAEPRIERRALEAAIAGAERHRQRRQLGDRLAGSGFRAMRGASFGVSMPKCGCLTENSRRSTVGHSPRESLSTKS